MDNDARSKFLARRRAGVGGSDVGPILGVDTFRDSLDVWTSKVKPVPEEERFQNPQMIRGTMLEPIVATLYLEETGRKLRLGKFRRHGKHRRFIGHPDRIVLATSKDPKTIYEGPGVLELKTANRFVFSRMKEHGLPQSYVLQLQHYMAICRMKWGAFAVLCPEPWEFVTFVMDFDAELFEEVATVLNRFWTDHVETKNPPIPEKGDVWHDAPKIPDDEPVIPMDGDEWAMTVASLREATEIKKAGEAAERYAKDTMKHLMSDEDGEPRYGVFQGAGLRAYHRLSPGRTTLQRRSLEAMEPLDPIIMASLLASAGLSLDVIEALFEESRLDLTRFDKVGAPFPTLRTYDSKGDDQ